MNAESAARQKAIFDELAELSREQSDALQKAIFLSFTREQRKEYDARAERIHELARLVGDFKR